MPCEMKVHPPSGPLADPNDTRDFEVKWAEWELYRARTEGGPRPQWAIDVLAEWREKDDREARRLSSQVSASARTLGRRVRRERAFAGITQGALAEKLGVTQAVVSRMEAGKRPIRAAELKMIADVLEVSVDDFFR